MEFLVLEPQPRMPNWSLCIDYIVVPMSQQGEPWHGKKNDILIGNPNKSGYIPRITQAFKSQPLLAAPAVFLSLGATPRTR